MCFVKAVGRERHMVAVSDIECYKVVVHGIGKDENVFHSPYCRYPYVLGELYDTGIGGNLGDVGLMDDVEWLTYGVFHSYKTEWDSQGLYRESSHACSNGAYSFYPSKKRINAHHAHIVKCVIPRGSVYWENKYEYASSAIRLVEVVI